MGLHKTAAHGGTESCKEVFALLSQYIDLELPPDACEQIRHHLQGCPPCIDFAESLRSTVELCRKYEPSDLPKPLADEARAQLQRAWKAAR